MNKLSGRIEVWHIKGIGEWESVPPLGKLALIRDVLLSYKDRPFKIDDIRKGVEALGVRVMSEGATRTGVSINFRSCITSIGNGWWKVSSAEEISKAGAYNVKNPEKGTQMALVCELTAGYNKPFRTSEINNALRAQCRASEGYLHSIPTSMKKLGIMTRKMVKTHRTQGAWKEWMYVRAGTGAELPMSNDIDDQRKAIKNNHACQLQKESKEIKLNKLSGRLEAKHFEGFTAWREIPVIGRAVIIRDIIRQYGNTPFTTVSIRDDLRKSGYGVPSTSDVTNAIRSHFGNALQKIDYGIWGVADIDSLNKVGVYDTSNPIKGVQLSLACEITYGYEGSFHPRDIERVIAKSNNNHSICAVNLSALIRESSLFQQCQEEGTRRRISGERGIRYVRRNVSKAIYHTESEEYQQEVPFLVEVDDAHQEIVASNAQVEDKNDLTCLITAVMSLSNTDKIKLILTVMPDQDEAGVSQSIESAYPEYLLKCEVGDRLVHPTVGLVEIQTATKDRLTFYGNGTTWVADRNGYIITGKNVSDKRLLFNTFAEYEEYFKKMNPGTI